MKSGFGTGAAPQPGEPTQGQAFEPPLVTELGKLFPQLEIVELVGWGGMGAVYKARQPALDRWVALKILAPQCTGKPGFADRFNREARALARLNHPGIVAVHEFGQIGGMPYFIMEYVDGVTLRQLVQEHRLPPQQALKIVPQICEALQYAHDEGVVHRDIKPENILLDKKGRVKIADFGIAKIIGPDAERSNITAEQVVGTPHYMAPEQIEHPRDVDHRADIYSVGVVFYEMLTGELPLGKFAPPSQKVEIDVRLDEIVLHALEKEPKRRYQHVSEVKTDVENVAQGNTEGNGHSAPPSEPPSKARSLTPVRSHRKAWAWIGGAGALASLVLLVLALLSPKSTPSAFRPIAHSGGIVFPPDAGVIDVTKPPYHAKGDGQTDATAAIQQALSDNRNQNAIIYLPDGIYLVSDTLFWGASLEDMQDSRRTTLQGQTRDGTILRLRDACPGFTEPANPKSVIYTGPKGEDHVRNSLRNLTVDIGRNNPGAIGVRFTASSVGCVRDVSIQSSDGQGQIGLDMGYVDLIGPLLVKNLTVRGFNIGITLRDTLYARTFEHIILEEQNQVGFLNRGQGVSIRDLTFKGRVTALRNEGSQGLAVIVDAKLRGYGEAEGQPAIWNRPGMLVRNVTVEGFAHAIMHTGAAATNVPGPSVREWVSREYPNSAPSLNLPVKETPEVAWGALTEWASARPGGVQTGDDSEAIQRAIDSGKQTVYLPRGDYQLRRPVYLRGRVQRLIGCEANLVIDMNMPGSAALMLAEGEAPVVVIERLGVNFGPTAMEHKWLDNRSSRTLVLRDIAGGEAELTGPGEIFMENVGMRLVLHGQKLWARQLHQTTRHSMPREQWYHMKNEGGTVWVLGHATAGPGTLVNINGGGKTELLGGSCYVSAMAREQPDPAYVVEKGEISVSMYEVNHGRLSYPVLVRRAEPDRMLDLLMPREAPGGINASCIPMFATREGQEVVSRKER